MKHRGENISEEEISQIPVEKLRELIDKTNGGLRDCPECGTMTLFVGKTGMSDESECHSCGYKIGF
jgi:uncharacterized protein (DUF983 family)